jgi:radical SAM protein with 4Fe4S-binding SPASM domain
MNINPGFYDRKLTKEVWSKEYKEYRKKWHDWPVTGHVGDYPLHIDLEVTNRCNLRCPFCVREFMEGLGDMTMKTAVTVIEECNGNVPSIKFNWRGEPTLNENLPLLIELAKRNGFIETAINTNGTKIDRTMMRRLCDAGLDRLIFSIDSHTKENYEKQRVGAKFEATIANLMDVVAYKQAFHLNKPYIRVQKVDLPELRSENAGFLNYFSMMGVDSVAINSYKEKNAGKVDWEPLQCAQPFQRMMVTWDGRFLPCCQGNLFDAIGKVGKMTVEDAWNSPIMTALREIHHVGLQKKIKECRECETTKPVDYMINVEGLK